MSLVTIIEACLNEHASDDKHQRCRCGEKWQRTDHGTTHRAHQAERVAARLGIEPFIPALTIRPVFRVRALEGSDVPTE